MSSRCDVRNRRNGPPERSRFVLVPCTEIRWTFLYPVRARHRSPNDNTDVPLGKANGYRAGGTINGDGSRT